MQNLLSRVGTASPSMMQMKTPKKAGRLSEMIMTQNCSGAYMIGTRWRCRGHFVIRTVRRNLRRLGVSKSLGHAILATVPAQLVEMPTWSARSFGSIICKWIPGSGWVRARRNEI
jgi:hypothetical protein